MSDARRHAVWPEPRSRSRSLKGSRPSVPHGTNFFKFFLFILGRAVDLAGLTASFRAHVNIVSLLTCLLTAEIVRNGF